MIFDKRSSKALLSLKLSGRPGAAAFGVDDFAAHGLRRRCATAAATTAGAGPIGEAGTAGHHWETHEPNCW